MIILIKIFFESGAKKHFRWKTTSVCASSFQDDGKPEFSPLQNCNAFVRGSRSEEIR